MESVLDIDPDSEYILVHADPVTKDFSVFTAYEWNHISGMLQGLDMKKRDYNDLSDAEFTAIPEHLRNAAYFYLSKMQNENGFVGFSSLCVGKCSGRQILESMYKSAHVEDVRVNVFRSCVASVYKDLVNAYLVACL